MKPEPSNFEKLMRLKGFDKWHVAMLCRACALGGTKFGPLLTTARQAWEDCLKKQCEIVCQAAGDRMLAGECGMVILAAV